MSGLALLRYRVVMQPQTAMKQAISEKQTTKPTVAPVDCLAKKAMGPFFSSRNLPKVMSITRLMSARNVRKK